MLISPAYAQAAGGDAGGLISFLPLVLIFAVFYFLLIRPQQKKMKAHREMIGNVRRNDRVVTGGGIIGKITKVVDEQEVDVDPVRDLVEAASQWSSRRQRRCSLKKSMVRC